MYAITASSPDRDVLLVAQESSACIKKECGEALDWLLHHPRLQELPLPEVQLSEATMFNPLCASLATRWQEWCAARQAKLMEERLPDATPSHRRARM